MFYKYLILNVNNEPVLYLYINNYEEFASDFKNKNDNNKKNLYQQVKNFITTNKINFSGKKIMFVINGLIIGSMALGISTFDNIKNDLQTNNTTKTNYYITEEKVAKEAYPNHNKVLIKNKKGSIDKILFDDYLTSAIGMSIPATYEKEALKTLAVILRTDAFKEIYEKKYLDNDNNLYQDITVFKNAWGNNFQENYDSIYQAVSETDNEYLSHNNYFINTKPMKIVDNYIIGYSISGINILAKSGYDYKTILNNYYPNAKITKL